MHGCVLLYPMQQVAKGIMFLTLLSVSQSVRKSISPFFYQHNFSETPHHKLCSYEGHTMYIVDVHNYSHFYQNVDIIVQRYIFYVGCVIPV